MPLLGLYLYGRPTINYFSIWRFMAVSKMEITTYVTNGTTSKVFSRGFARPNK